jgi:transcriptional regulator with XRE-family HTH domain
MPVIDLKISFIQMLKKVRKEKGITQDSLAKLIKSSQSRMAMLESGSPDVSFELIFKSLALKVSSKAFGKTISQVQTA